MTEAANSSFTDLLLNQPVLVWSLAGGISILVLAGFLSLFFSVRSRNKKEKEILETAKDDDLTEAEAVQTAVSELKTIAQTGEEEEETSENSRGPSLPPIETVALGADGEGDPDAASFIQTAGGGDGSDAAVVQAEPLEESGGGAFDDESSDLAALFETDVIVDPHVQALRDNLPDVPLDELLAELRAVSARLQECIGSAGVSR